MILLALAISCAPAPAQELPSASPHPSYVLSTDYVREALEHNGWPDRDGVDGRWVALDPRWLTLDAEWGELLLMRPEGRAALGEFVRARNNWERSEVENWLSLMRPAPVALEYRLTDAAGATAILAGSESVIPGVPKVLSDYRRRSVVMDFDVEIAQQSDIADPVLGLQYAGNSLALELLPVPGVGYRAELCLVSTGFGEDDAISTGYYAIDGKDRLRQELAELGVTTVLRPGVPASIRLPGLRGQEQVLFLQVEGAVPAPHFQAGSAAFASVVPTLAAREDYSSLVAELELGGDTWSSEDGYLGFAGPEAQAQAEEAAARARAAARMVRYELEVTLEGSNGSAGAWSLVAESVADQPLRFAQGQLGHALFDWDVEVACTARIADPVFETLFSGVQGSLAVNEDGQVELGLDLRRVEHGHSVLLQLSGERPGMLGHEGPAPAMPGDRVAVERPEQARMYVEGVFEPDSQGVVRVVRGSSQFLPGGAELRLELKVSELP